MKANNCQNCGPKLVPTMIEGRELGKCPVCGFVDYDGPATVAVGLIEKDGGVVLVKRNIKPVDKWCLPAGFANTGETPAQACKREVKEESGLDIETARAPFDILGVNILNQNLHFFLATSCSGEMKPGSDSKEVGVFTADNLPDMAFPLHTQVIKAHFAAKKS